METSRLIVLLKQFMDIIWYITLFLVVVFIITLLIPGYEPTMSHAVKFRLDEGSYSIISNNAAVENPVLTGASGDITYRLSGMRKSFLLLVGIPGLTFVLLIIDRLRGILEAILKGKLLNRSNVNSLRLVGSLLIAGELWEWLVNGLSSIFVARTFDAEGLILLNTGFKINFDFNTGSGLFSGFIILVVAEIIAYALTLQNERDALRDEQALTV